MARQRALAVGALAFAGWGNDDNNSSSSSGGGGAAKKSDKVAVLLPDSKSSVRWQTVDRPFLKEATWRSPTSPRASSLSAGAT